MARTQAGDRRAPWQRLHVRAALAAVPLLLALGCTMYFMLQHFSAQTALEAGQRMNLGLARYVVEHQAPGLIGRDGQPNRARMKELGLHVMMITPAVEVYLLNPRGQVLAHALEGLQGPDPEVAQIDLLPVHHLLAQMAGGVPRLPVLGTDPRNTTRANTFSVASVEGGPAGSAGNGPSAYLSTSFSTEAWRSASRPACRTRLPCRRWPSAS